MQSYTARQQQFEDHAQKAVALKLLGGPDTRIQTARSEKAWTVTLGDLARRNRILRTGFYPEETAQVRRVVFHDRYATSFDAHDADEGKELSWYFVRVRQANHQFAWSSPIWVEKAKEARSASREHPGRG